jgi:acetylglutamate kinase
VPVVATVAPGRRGDGTAPFFNLNADHAAGPLCAALRGSAMLFLTDVPGVLDRDKRLIPVLDPARCDALVRDGVATGGMLPKLEAARLASGHNPGAIVKIAPGGGADAILEALRPDVGTRFRASPSELSHG